MLRTTTISSSDKGGEISKALKRLSAIGVETADKVYRAAAIQTFTDILVETPVDNGLAKNNWQASFDTPITKVLTTKNKTKGFAYINKRFRKPAISVNKNGKIKTRKMYLSNNLPYIAVLEFGRYPDPVKRGTYVKGKGYEKRSSSGFSRLAPKGMVRKNIAKFPQKLKAIAGRFK